MELRFVDGVNNELNIKNDVIACIGEFDGLHIAHQELVNETLRLARKHNMMSALITFYPHPDYVLGKREYEGYLNTLEEKQELLKMLGIDYFIVIKFDEKTAKLSKDAFYNFFLKDFKGLVMGSDYRFGFKGEGNSLYLKEKFNIISVVDIINYKDSSLKVGSEMIRTSLSEGNIALANDLLGRKFSYQGVVEEGRKLGRTFGFPTANIKIGKEYFKIKKGVYAVESVIENKSYLGIANFGNNPTCNFVDEARLEVHFFNFNESVYGKNIKVDFIKFIREEKKFNEASDLVEQITKDIEEVIKEFGGKL